MVMLYASWLMLWLGGSLVVGAMARPELVIVAELGWFIAISGYVMLHGPDEPRAK